VRPFTPASSAWQNATAVIRGRIRRAALAFAAATVLFAVPTQVAHGKATSAAGPVSVTVAPPKGGATILSRIPIQGQVTTGVSTPVDLRVSADGRELFVKRVTPNASGAFSFPLVVDACCRYSIVAQQGTQSSTPVGFDVRIQNMGRKGPLVRLFIQKLSAAGYHTGGKGARINHGVRLAILAFRKVNRMGRSMRYKKGIFRRLLQGRGEFNLAHPNDGKHVEVDLSRQVMVLADDGKPQHTFHVSSGAGGTPTVTGKFHFYRKDPGYNAKRMFFSAYFIGGYATHGYNPVPNHPASHGCVRNPIPFAIFIYNWINIGDPIWVYH
jgi:lipoprotein-anchoring transpeptidase ErfK/SrfK